MHTKQERKLVKKYNLHYKQMKISNKTNFPPPPDCERKNKHWQVEEFVSQKKA